MYRKFILKDNTNPAQIRRIWAKSGAGAGFVKMAGFRIYRSRSRNPVHPLKKTSMKPTSQSFT